MEDHILESHVEPDENNMFKCDACQFTSMNKIKFGFHYKIKHGSKKTDTNQSSQNEDELRLLKMNFQRLESMYKESLDEAERVKADYELKLVKASDENIRISSENIVLKERIDILYKLGRQYLEKHEGGGDITDRNTVMEQQNRDVIVLADNTQNNVEQTWASNNLRGFKRKTPLQSAADGSNGTETVPSQVREQARVSIPPPSRISEDDTRTGTSRQYCHFYVNTGKCSYEERTGLKCKYLHQKAPMCRFGLNCNKMRCMFSHPKVNEGQVNNFLRATRNSMNQNFPNPWLTQTNVMNPWASMMNQLLAPWQTQMQTQPQQ